MSAILRRTPTLADQQNLRRPRADRAPLPRRARALSLGPRSRVRSQSLSGLSAPARGQSRRYPGRRGADFSRGRRGILLPAIAASSSPGGEWREIGAGRSSSRS
jgi:hypothetical protein